jgi:hypothetical protein
VQDINHKIKLIDLRKISKGRNTIPHESLHTVDDRRTFIEKCQEHEWPKEYDHSTVIKDLINIVAHLDSDATNTKLQSF